MPEVIDVEQRRYPAVQRVVDVLGGEVTVDRVPIPHDCTDGFTEAYYARPEALLDPGARAAQSGWMLADPASVRRGTDRLAADLATGEWDRRHGHLRGQPTYSGSLVLITSRTEED